MKVWRIIIAIAIDISIRSRKMFSKYPSQHLTSPPLFGRNVGSKMWVECGAPPLLPQNLVWKWKSWSLIQFCRIDNPLFFLTLKRKVEDWGEVACIYCNIFWYKFIPLFGLHKPSTNSSHVTLMWNSTSQLHPSWASWCWVRWRKCGVTITPQVTWIVGRVSFRLYPYSCRSF